MDWSVTLGFENRLTREGRPCTVNGDYFYVKIQSARSFTVIAGITFGVHNSVQSVGRQAQTI